MNDDDVTARKTPPVDEKEWAYLWRGAHRANISWPIVGPIYAFVVNWKAWAIGLAFLLWINRPEVLAALTTLMGGK